MTDQQIVIANEFLRVSFDRMTGAFSIHRVSDLRAEAPIGMLVDATGPAKAVDTTDPIFGTGRAIEIGSAATIRLFPGLPFALAERTVPNEAATAVTVDSVPAASFALNLGLPAAKLRTFGTGGLAAPADCSGSYTWIAVADPATRAGVVAGWITQERGSGVLLPSVDGDTVTVEARCDFGGLLLKPGESVDAETLAIGLFDDARLGLEKWADAVARRYDINLPPQPCGYCSWYGDKHGGPSDQDHISELAAFAAERLGPFGFDFVQIDDGWQLGDACGNGPRKNFAAFDPNGPYADGMRATAERIAALGLVPGLWLMPFAGTHGDPWFADKQSFFVRRKDGEPYETEWGGTSIDMTVPEARDYLRSVIERIVHRWGYGYLKLDGLYTGIAAELTFLNDSYKEDGFGDAQRADPSVSGIEAFRIGLKLIREAAGPNAFLLGCCIPQNMRSFGASLGLLDAMRIGEDNEGNWQAWSRVSPKAGARSYFLNGRVWHNDPDPFYVRAGFSLEEARTSASWPAVAGQLLSISDWLPELPAERLDILKRIIPAHGKLARPVDLFENDRPRVWTVTDASGPVRRDVVALFNWNDEEASFDIPVARLNLPSAETYAAFEFWTNTFQPSFGSGLAARVPAHACRLFAVRPLLDRPLVLSTSRHVAQGMVDLADEQWSQEDRTLRGASRVVAGDTYELRILAPSHPHAWQAIETSASADDSQVGVTVTFGQEGEHVRLEIVSPVSRTVTWQVRF